MLVGSLLEEVFDVACTQKAWDHFTKPQRKTITQWKEFAAVRWNLPLPLFFLLSHRWLQDKNLEAEILGYLVCDDIRLSHTLATRYKCVSSLDPAPSPSPFRISVPKLPKHSTV